MLSTQELTQIRNETARVAKLAQQDLDKAMIALVPVNVGDIITDTEEGNKQYKIARIETRTWEFSSGIETVLSYWVFPMTKNGWSKTPRHRGGLSNRINKKRVTINS